MGAETGNPVTPSADLLREGQAAFGWQEKGKERSFQLAAAPAERWEVSLQRSAAHDDRAGVKFAVQPESIFKPGIALGVEDLSAERQRSVYGVTVSRAFCRSGSEAFSKGQTGSLSGYLCLCGVCRKAWQPWLQGIFAAGR